LITQTCSKCKRRFELDPVQVGFELSRLKKKTPTFYQAECPSCHTLNKVSVNQIQSALDGVKTEIQAMIAEYEQSQLEKRANADAPAAGDSPQTA
jgi:hypothetical protein